MRLKFSINALFVVITAGACCLLQNASHAESQRLQVYILAGQSNMQGHAQLRTFEHIGMDPATKPMLDEMQGPDGKPTVCDRVWISSLGSAEEVKTGKLTAGFGASQNGPKIGPEFTFGLTMQKATKAPILLIKTAWGGKSLHTDFRPPSAGPATFSEAQIAAFTKQGKDVAALQAEKTAASGEYYRQMLAHVKKVLADIPSIIPSYKADQGYDLAGFAWFQGWNDLVDGGAYPNRDKPNGYAAYGEVLAHFIRDVRKDLASPQLPFAIGVLGVGGPTELYSPEESRYKTTHENFRQAMASPASLPEFKGNVVALRTEKFWDLELSKAKRKDNKLRQDAKQQAKQQNLAPKEEAALAEKLRTEGLTERERLTLEKGISNQEFHYLGSAKILGGIGKGLAESLISLPKPNSK